MLSTTYLKTVEKDTAQMIPWMQMADCKASGSTLIQTIQGYCYNEGCCRLKCLGSKDCEFAAFDDAFDPDTNGFGIRTCSLYNQCTPRPLKNDDPQHQVRR